MLRLFKNEDAEEVSIMCNNYNIYKSTLSLPYPYTTECAAMWIEKHNENFDKEYSFTFAITDKQSGELYGSISLSNSKMHKNGEMGYWIGEEHWNKGYATEAALALIKFAI